MATTELRSEVVSYLSDAVAMEGNVEQMLQSMISTTDDEQIRRRLEDHLEETHTQKKRLEGRLEAYGESPSTLKEMTAKAAATMKGMMDMARSDKPARNARDGYTTEHLEIASYRLLEAVADIAGDPATAEVARTNRAEEEAMASFFSDHWEDVARRALKEAGATT